VSGAECAGQPFMKESNSSSPMFVPPGISLFKQCRKKRFRARTRPVWKSLFRFVFLLLEATSNVGPGHSTSLTCFANSRNMGRSVLPLAVLILRKRNFFQARRSPITFSLKPSHFELITDIPIPMLTQLQPVMSSRNSSPIPILDALRLAGGTVLAQALELQLTCGDESSSSLRMTTSFLWNIPPDHPDVDWDCYRMGLKKTDEQKRKWGIQTWIIFICKTGDALLIENGLAVISRNSACFKFH